MASTFGQMGACTSVNGTVAGPPGRESSAGPPAPPMRVSSRVATWMGKGLIRALLETHIKALG
ncbi:hypothetical protein FH972_026953 [Carpinus fangiana]|uniref:Uncharacterized protein n=1 Tax=Carpinus fangiana TaxID=176857 RepID=A0A5N6L6A8_9ROSI|nr:hypothetical protein FH972_026953 [Carpinus fangiana]